MTTAKEELEELAEGKSLALITLSNSANIDIVLVLRFVPNDIETLHIETFAREINDSARVLGVVQGNFVSINRKKLYYGGTLLHWRGFRGRVLSCAIAPEHYSSIEYEELKSKMSEFIKGRA